jgi:hypothetical protein
VNILVVPTNRAERFLAFLAAWRPWPWDRLLVIEDAPEISLRIPATAPDGRPFERDRVEVYSWREIDGSLPQPWIISRQDSAIRSYGFWRAWAMGATHIFSLDDDCFPVPEDHFVRTHLRNLHETPTWQSSVPGLRVRGLPYRNMGTLGNVYLSMGLWAGQPDVDAVNALVHGPLTTAPGFERQVSSRVMPGAQYFPMCGMNLAFRREIACLMYFPPMGRDSAYSRFDDIWGGLVLQRVCRHLRYAIVCGRPLVEHRQGSDPFVNLVKEAPGIQVNEHLWEVLDAIPLRGQDPLTCMQEVGNVLGQQGEYLGRWGRAVLDWCKLFERDGTVRSGPEVEP